MGCCSWTVYLPGLTLSFYTWPWERVTDSSPSETHYSATYYWSQQNAEVLYLAVHDNWHCICEASRGPDKKIPRVTMWTNGCSQLKTWGRGIMLGLFRPIVKNRSGMFCFFTLLNSTSIQSQTNLFILVLRGQYQARLYRWHYSTCFESRSTILWLQLVWRSDCLKVLYSTLGEFSIDSLLVCEGEVFTGPKPQEAPEGGATLLWHR